MYQRPKPTKRHSDRAHQHFAPGLTTPPLRRLHGLVDRARQGVHKIEHDLGNDSVYSLYVRLNAAAVDGKFYETQHLAEYLVSWRHEAPSLVIYNALIMSNISAELGAAWRIHLLLSEMETDGLQPDPATCHAVLKVLAVHSDHLLRSDVLAYMRKKWFTLSQEGAHDTAAGWIRDGCLELALERVDMMCREGMRMESWLPDMLTYALCDVGEIGAAFRLVRTRWDGGELKMSRTLWHHLLDRASEARHFAATDFVWRTQVQPQYIHVSSGICLNVLTTASVAADPALATDVLTYLTKRGDKPDHIHYQLLIDAYMSSEPPDLERALTIPCVMQLEKVPPTAWQTRSLFLCLRDSSSLTAEAFATLQKLYKQHKVVPIALLNLIIECYSHQKNPAEAFNVYKQIHCFIPTGRGAKRSIANTHTFNHLLRACRFTKPPDAKQAKSLVSEMLALRVHPDGLTYDRQILVFVAAASYHHVRSPARPSAQIQKEEATPSELLDSAMKHLEEMSPQGWSLRFGTLETLAFCLARFGDERCWQVLRYGQEHAAQIEGWDTRSRSMLMRVEKEWEKSSATDSAHHMRNGALSSTATDSSTQDLGADVEVARAAA